MGPWNGGYGLRHDHMEVTVRITHTAASIQFHQIENPNVNTGSSAIIEEISDMAVDPIQLQQLPAPVNPDITSLAATSEQSEPVYNPMETELASTMFLDLPEQEIGNSEADSSIQNLTMTAKQVGTLDLPQSDVVVELLDRSTVLNETSLLLPAHTAAASAQGHNSTAPGSSVPNQHKGKAPTPIDCSNLRRSTRNNKYDGFKIHQPTDGRQYKSKVKARMIPSALNSNTTQNTSGNTEATEVIPPPTTIPMMQAIGVQLYAIPEEELTTDTLVKEPEES